jgi:hypothetical protein
MSKNTLVIGVSTNSSRYSHVVVKKLTAKGHKVSAIGLTEGYIDGVQIERGMPKFKNIDTVTIYLNKQNQKQYYDYILSLNPVRIIFNPGAENEEFMTLLKEKGFFAEEACTLVLLSTNQY